ncbi:DNA-binding response regulator, NarL/FixJ family, contains REC and HTH domains [Lentzea fradiae]|uniref:DNA-binding response regulator, NarL/FixJ family, contains REC and HTH domains n=1 Tax=Lentzea fradiae TaxID=200378 RepID=A0A1G7K7V2_9PSEU|nr:response regulator transcription factor [Lentzea fradiae]SDF33252.1 DNA-binding response regulator, NarL/FixJ family, contains REC and HTH domains [Lentzea fradiae]
MTIRVLVVDDQAMIRESFRVALDSQSDVDVVGEAGTGAEAVALTRDLAPDVVLMDVRMPVMDGLEATRLITGSGEAPPKVLVLTTFDLDEHVYGALRAGASGFMLKDSPLSDLINAVRVVASGHALFAPSITRRLVAAYADRAPGKPDGTALRHLTPREAEVLRLVARGLSNAEIAEALTIAEQTAKSHVSRVLTKLGLRDRAQAVVLAYECGLVVPAE